MSGQDCYDKSPCLMMGKRQKTYGSLTTLLGNTALTTCAEPDHFSAIFSCDHHSPLAPTSYYFL